MGLGIEGAPATVPTLDAAEGVAPEKQCLHGLIVRYWQAAYDGQRDVMIGIKSPRKCFPLSLIVVDAKADLQTKGSNGHGQDLSQKLIGVEPVSPLRASSANKHG